MPHLVDVRRNRTAPPGRLEERLRLVVSGEVCFGPGDRALYATDGSNYRQPPIGVVVPRDAEDVVAAMEVCRDFDVPVLARGGGTSLAGQCCNSAVVFDFSKYMREVLEIDRERRMARVLPGTVLDSLNHQAARRGLVFAPDPSTHNHCVIGGMIGNDSCGVHAVQGEFYGPGPRTEDHVHELEILTYDGDRMRVGPCSDEEYERLQREGGRKAEIYRRLRELRDRYADEIRARFPDIPRRVSGYGLPALLPENGFHVARSLVGSEGTLVTVLEASLHLGPTFDHRALLILGYDDICLAGDAVPALRALEIKPIGIEGMDDKLVEFIRRKGMTNERYLPLLPDGEGWLLVEFGGASPEEAEEAARAALRELRRDESSSQVALLTDEEDQGHLWAIRKSGLGATAYVPGKPDTWPGWEDSAVPPERVGDYLRELRALFDRYGYEASVYGHFGQGCLHCRIPFDLRSEAGIADYRSFSREAAELVVGYGGSLSGEHGDGQARGDLLPIMFGDRIMEAFREMKAIWDPRGRMNPGKLVDAAPRDANLRLGADYDPWEPKTNLAFTEEEEGRFSRAALRCVGVGECRREGGGTMCPSYMVTHDEKHSTRGRARLLFEMLQGDVVTDGWKSESVKEALDLCLSCKGCKSDCPVSVDMALYKTEFLSHYYEGRLRPRHAYAFGLIDRWARLGSRLPSVANWASHAPGLSALAKAAADMAPEREVPQFAGQTFRRWFRQRGRKTRAVGPKRRVLLWPDTFNNYFRPQTLAAATEALESAGVDVDIPPRPLCCGRPLYDYGMIGRARSYWKAILDTLEAEIEGGTTVVGVEPSCVAAFRDELREVFDDDPRAAKLSRQTLTFAEYLGSLEGWEPPRLEGKALYHGHCHHKAVMGVEPDQQLLARMGLDVEAPATGCCGMAGAFGFERDHYEVSVACGERMLLPRVREKPEADLVVADGFSCREQIRQLTARRAMHVAEVVQLALHQQQIEQRHAAPEDDLDSLRPPELSPAGSPAFGRAAAALAGAVAAGSAAWYWLAPLLGG